MGVEVGYCGRVEPPGDRPLIWLRRSQTIMGPSKQFIPLQLPTTRDKLERGRALDLDRGRIGHITRVEPLLEVRVRGRITHTCCGRMIQGITIEGPPGYGQAIRGPIYRGDATSCNR